VKIIGNTAFLYIKVGNMYAVAVSQGNAQAALAFQFLHEVVKVLKNYFGDFTEESIRNNFVLIYELLDEVLDYGYPQNCSTDVLKLYITQQGDKSAAAERSASQVRPSWPLCSRGRLSHECLPCLLAAAPPASRR